MCGITGYAGFDDPALLRVMCRRLVHRGPDEEGFYRHPQAGLAMRRLAVIDLVTGHQPIANETGDVWVVFNGEIYNHETLREQLARSGHRFTIRSDTEVIVHLYEEHGLDFVDHLRGMFAIALWDCVRERLVLVRDRLGEKPLFYAVCGRRLLFGSEIKAILPALPARRADRAAVSEFLAAGYVAGTRTFFEGIRRLPPAHRLIWEEGHARLERYWRLPTQPKQALGFEEAVERLDTELREAERLCQKSDVEVGAFLSGGIDSSLLVALMREAQARVQTFTVGYTAEADGYNELAWARQVARTFGTKHRELILDAHAQIELLPRVIAAYDEPHGEPTSVLVYQLCRFTREHLKVAVGGTGGDELFFGYPRHAGLHYRACYLRIPRWLRRGLIEPALGLFGESTRGGKFVSRVRRLVAAAEASLEEAYLRWVSLVPDSDRARLLEAEGSHCGQTDDEFLRARLFAPDEPMLDRIARLDLEGYLPEYQLAYMDRMSMANGLEVRSPLTDWRLVEYVATLPSEYRLLGTRSKHLLKACARRYLPAAVVERRKVGFDSPIGQWFKTQLRDFLLRFLAPSEVARTGLLVPAMVEKLMHEHLGGRRNHALLLWSFISLEAWHRLYIEQRADDPQALPLEAIRGVVAENPARGQGRRYRVPPVAASQWTD